MEMETLIPEISRLLSDTLSPDNALVSSATEGLDRLSSLTAFPRCLLAITTGGENLGQRIAASAYLKNFIRRGIEGRVWSSEVRRQLSNQLVQALLQVEPAVIKVLAEAFHLIVVKDFVSGNAWPELVPEIRSVIQNSNLISGNEYSQWKTINALAVVKMIVKPFQYFLNPKLSREPVPLQLELIATEVLVPLQATFHHAVNKALSCQGRIEVENEQVLLTICKCLYFAVRSYMPSALSPLLPSFCHDLFGILDSLNLDGGTLEDAYLLRLKTGKRCLIIFSTLVTRHRKHADKLMPNIITCASKIARLSANIVKLDFLSERIVSLAFDVISHVLETGPGWRLISPHFSSLLESTIFPALVLNQKDITEWEEDQEEYIRKNLPSDLEEISGWNEDFFTARKSAINLLGVIAMSKGPPMVSLGNTSAASVKRKKGSKNKGKEQRFFVGELLVMPFLSRFPIPSNAMETPSKILYDYYGVLMAYGGLQDFLKEKNPEYTANLVRSRMLPLYSSCHCLPYLIATANWVIGELAPCLPQEVCADVYSLFVKVLAMPDGDLSLYPVRASAAGAVKELLENDYMPSDWLPLLHVLVDRVNSGDEIESSLLLQLLSTVVETGQQNVAIHIPLIVSNIVSIISKELPSTLEPWSQVVEHGFAALAVMAQTWEDSMPEEVLQNRSSKKWQPGWLAIARSFSCLLQQAWLLSVELTDGADSRTLPPPSCVDDASKLLGFIARFITGIDEAADLKIIELLVVWADLIADWNEWQGMEGLSIFSSIREAVNLLRKFNFQSFCMVRVPSQPSPPGTLSSIIEGMGVFVSKAISEYSSAVWRACSSAHLLLHVPTFTIETESVKQSLAVAFTQAAFSRYKDIRTKHSALWKPLLLLISSCYLCYPQNIEKILENNGEKGLTVWACGLADICTSSFEPALSSESEMKLAVMALAKVIERLLCSPSDMQSVVLRNCFVSLMEVYIRLKEVQEESNDDDDDKYDDADDVDDEDSFEETDDDEDSDKEEREETEEEFLDRYAKAAAALEDEMVIEGDVEDEVDEDLELGVLSEIDIQQAVLSLIERHHQVLVGGQMLSSQLITEFLNAFPEYISLFQQHSSC